MGRRQCNPTHVPGISLGQHLDNDSSFVARPQQRVNWWQVRIEPYIHNAAAHRDHHAEIR